MSSEGTLAFAGAMSGFVEAIVGQPFGKYFLKLIYF
jgi:hypothetical protein